MDWLGFGASILSGIIAITGSLLGWGATREGTKKAEEANKANIAAQEQINAQNIAAQEKENELMRQREDNAVQRRAGDLAAAGINPMLAGLGGASAGMGGVPALQAPMADTSIGAFFGQNTQNAISTGTSGVQESINQLERVLSRKQEKGLKEKELEQGEERLSIEEKRIKIEEEKTKLQSKLTDAEINNINASTDKINEEITSLGIQNDKTKEETKLLAQQILLIPTQKALIGAQTAVAKQTVQKILAEMANMSADTKKKLSERLLILAEKNLTEKQLDLIGEQYKQAIHQTNIIEYADNNKKFDNFWNKTFQVLDTAISGANAIKPINITKISK